MSSPDQLVSAIGPVILRYLDLKRALGRNADTLQYRLVQLDGFLAGETAKDLDSETFDTWCSSLDHLAASTRRSRMQTVYQLCLFRRRSEPTCFLPDPNLFPPLPPRPRPYIFSEEDIRRILLLADGLEPHPSSPLHRQVCRIAVVLLYTSGLRRGELVRLRLGDYDPAEHVLLVRESKFYKSRLVPLSEDAVADLGRYLDDRRRPHFPCGDDAPLLLHRHGALTGYSGPGLGRLLRKLFRAADVCTSAGRSPRVHDLRFTFAVHAMLRWYRAGVDVQARLPALSIYMGHASVVSTQYYLVFLDAIAEAAGDRFEEHCSRLLQTPSFDGGEA